MKTASVQVGWAPVVSLRLLLSSNYLLFSANCAPDTGCWKRTIKAWSREGLPLKQWAQICTVESVLSMNVQHKIVIWPTDEKNGFLKIICFIFLQHTSLAQIESYYSYKAKLTPKIHRFCLIIISLPQIFGSKIVFRIEEVLEAKKICWKSCRYVGDGK